MKVIRFLNNIVYFVAKGTVILCLTKKYNEKDITEIKKSKLDI